MKWVFFHIPKTGGWGLCQYLVKALGPSRVAHLRAGVTWQTVRPTGHEQALVGHWTYWGMWKSLDWDYDAVRCFTYWRDPAERMWSQYKVLRRHRPERSFRSWADTNLRLCDCLHCAHDETKHRDHPMTRNVASRVGVGAGDEDASAGAAKVLLDHVDVVPVDRIDAFQERVLFPALALDGRGYERLNVTEPEPISDADRQFVYEHHPLDLELYRYGMERAWS